MVNHIKTDIIASSVIGFSIAALFINISYSTVTVIRPDEAPPFYYWFSLVVFPLSLMAGMFVANDFFRKLNERFLAVYQFFKFALVEALGILLNIVIYSSLIVATQKSIGDPVTLFKGVGFSAALINNYFWNKHWTFFSNDNSNFIVQFSRFVVISLVGLGISTSINYILIDVVGPVGGIKSFTWGGISSFAGIIFSGMWNFFGYKYFVFR